MTTSSVLVTKAVLLSLGHFLEDFFFFKFRGQFQEALSYLVWDRAWVLLEFLRGSPGRAHSAFPVWCTVNPI